LAVSEDDQQKLLKLTSNKIVSEIDTKIKTKDSNLSSMMIGDLSYSEKEFSKKVGEEASELNLNLTGEVKVLLYSNSEIISQLSTKFISKTNSGMKLLEDQIKLEILPPLEQDPDTYKAQVKVNGLLIPVIDQDRYVSQLKGKSVVKLKNVLETIPGYKNTKIIIKPRIPFLSNYIPLNKGKIFLSITTSQ